MWESAVQKLTAAVEKQGQTKRQWDVIRGWAGRKKVTQQQREQLAEKLAEKQLLTYPAIDVVNPGAKDKVAVFHQDDYAKHYGLRFPTEKSFEEAVSDGIMRIEQLQGIQVVARQYHLSTNRVIDILCKRGSSCWVVIELKRKGGGNGTPTQVLKYVKDLRAQRLDDGTSLVKDHHAIEAIVISQELDEGAASALFDLAVSNKFTARWLTSRIEFDEYSRDR